jgi:hypothetical protein
MGQDGAGSEIRRCLARADARGLYRLLERQATAATMGS